MTQEIDVKVSSGNIFADLGLSNPEEMLLKAELAKKINDIISNRQMTQTQAAELLGIDQSQISALTKGRLTVFSVPVMFKFLNNLGHDVEVIVKLKPESRQEAKVTVVS
jgi:predicted XRE-type DNA-binding protein